MNTVNAELAFPLENRGYQGYVISRAVEEVSLAVGISHLLGRETHTLSGGELQRVVLAATLITRPKLLLLDEPTSQLDPIVSEEFISLLKRLNNDWGLTVLLSEHRLERCLSVADRVVVFEDGRVLSDNSPEGFLHWASKNKPYLQTPAAQIFTGLNIRPLPVKVKDARRLLVENFSFLEETVSIQKPQEKTFQKKISLKKIIKGRQDVSADFVLSCENLWYEFSGGKTVLSDISFGLKSGEKVALLGRNGVGKSTLMRILASLIKPTRGKVILDGRVALLLQNPGDYLTEETVIETARNAEFLNQFSLTGLSSKHPRDLSGGEKQRLALAMILNSNSELPSVLCLDEPTRGMDSKHKETLGTIIESFSRSGVAVIVATHDMEFAAKVTNRVMILGGGQLVADGSFNDVLKGGFYFTTETARVVDGFSFIEDALTPDDAVFRVKNLLTNKVQNLTPSKESEVSFV